MRMKDNIAAGVLALVVLAGGAARGQSVIVKVGVGVGTGLEVGRGESTVARASPAFVVLNGGLLFDNDQRVEVGAALTVELQGRVGVAVEPQVRLNMPTGRRFTPYLIGGVPIFLSPYTLYGVSVGPGVAVRLLGGLTAFGELFLRYYPFGNDLPEGGSLFHMDLAVGIRHAF